MYPLHCRSTFTFRFLLNLKYVSKHVYKDRIRFYDWKVVQNYIEKDGFMFKFDVSHRYYHIDIDKNHQKYLGLSWTIARKLRYFMFAVLPFGLCSAPFAFTKAMRCPVKFWRLHGIKILFFIDEGLGS